MVGLIHADDAASLPERPAVRAVFVNGVRFSNAAAKFWPMIIHEVGQIFPMSSSFELSATSAGPISRRMLFPELELEEDLARLAGSDLARTLQETLAALEMFGPPGPVTLRVFAGVEQIASEQLPADSLDSETFPYLFVWLFEWAGISEAKWNDAIVSGALSFTDDRLARTYRIEFLLENRHLSEGLYVRSLTVRPAMRQVGDCDERPRSV